MAIVARSLYSFSIKDNLDIITARLDDGSTDIIQSRSAIWGVLADYLSAFDYDTEYQQIALSADGTIAIVIWQRNTETLGLTNDIVQSRSAALIDPETYYVIKASNGNTVVSVFI